MRGEEGVSSSSDPGAEGTSQLLLLAVQGLEGACGRREMQLKLPGAGEWEMSLKLRGEK